MTKSKDERHRIGDEDQAEGGDAGHLALILRMTQHPTIVNSSTPYV